MLGLFTRRRWYLTGAGEAAAPRQRLDALVRRIADPEPRAIALAALARAPGMDRALYPGWAGRADRARLERIGRDQPAGPEVAGAVAALKAMDAAVIAAVIVAVSAGARATTVVMGGTEDHRQP